MDSLPIYGVAWQERGGGVFEGGYPSINAHYDFFGVILAHGCSNHLNLEMEAECLMKTLSYLNLNISRIKNGRNNL